MDRNKIIHTGCYTRVALEFFSALLWRKTGQIEQDFGLNVSVNRDFPSIINFDIWCWLMKTGHMKIHFVCPMEARIADDGEVVLDLNFTMSNRSPDIVTPRKIAIAMWRVYRNTALGIYYRHPEWKDAIKMMAKAVMRKLTAEDRGTDVFKDYIGYPLNPFEQEALKIKKDAVAEASEKLEQMFYLGSDYDYSVKFNKVVQLLDDFYGMLP